MKIYCFTKQNYAQSIQFNIVDISEIIFWKLEISK